MIVYESPKNKQLESMLFLKKILNKKELEEIGLEIQKELNIGTNDKIATNEINIIEVAIAKYSKINNLSIKEAFVKLVVEEVNKKLNISKDDLKLCSIGFNIESLSYVVGFNYQK